MNDLFDAIYDKFIADGKYGLANLYNTEADDKAAYPYATFSLVSAVSELADFKNTWEDCLIQFNLFDDDPLSTDISTAYEALKNAFHKFNLYVVGYETVGLVKEVANLIRVESVWRYNVSFRLTIQSSEVVSEILTYGLPKTGQIIEYQAGDDGTYEAGWWRGRLNADNRTRYIARTIDGDDVVFDLATGLMWAADGNAAGCNNGATIAWSNAIIYAEALSFAGFSDWRLPNVKELLSLIEYDADLVVAVAPLIQEPPFSNTARGTYGTSTTMPATTANYSIVNFYDGSVWETAKVNLRRIRACRQIT